MNTGSATTAWPNRQLTTDFTDYTKNFGHTGSYDLLQDIADFGGTDEGLRAFVVSVDVTADGLLQVSYAVEYAVTQTIDGDAAEETLNPVQPSG